MFSGTPARGAISACIKSVYGLRNGATGHPEDTQPLLHCGGRCLGSAEGSWFYKRRPGGHGARRPAPSAHLYNLLFFLRIAVRVANCRAKASQKIRLAPQRCR